ncbi:uracil-DNA glycosylase [Mycoplasma bradburyae]|uniref:Uracil-DNA glycosylase n=1 Tax=Mycoplasma bradburyae TaxID=2963128 RepID=A0ABT5GA98_9MOLU|nr:uracil-DNA glycosylase [Mycoplasma bradburyae]MDC4162986.1 uracil-DNA glycosylase [Mycoplasma bradburyae]MDC4181597.1 uracil-DNA glycosylase [Mycoplasma bradburyae]MDC4183768.1 uracil-DNA glycosylase [Mycoplasma bradburyae]UTS69980.1 uracil-DNA glycosylase [Mycoplasma bradburyae]
MLNQLISEIKTDWKNLITEFFDENKKIFNRLDELINTRLESNKLIPKKELIFNAFNYFDYQKTKVVIIGQDPYPSVDKANGLCFGVNTNKIPPSLRNIVKEMKNNLNLSDQDLNKFDYSLSHWAKQGVLLINTILTVKQKSALSDINLGWEELIKFLIIKLLYLKPQPVFVLWGNKASSFLKELDIKFALNSAHPSFFSQEKFFNNNHFNLVNEILKKNGIKPIDWL